MTASSPQELTTILCNPFARSPRKSITIVWFISLVFVSILFIVACLVAKNLSKSNTVCSFAVMWTALLCISLSVIGTLILKKYLTPLTTGWLLGAVLVLAQQNLVLFAIFADLAKDEGEDDKAAATFLFFLFVIYSVFGGLLYVFRQALVEEMCGGGSGGSTGMTPREEEGGVEATNYS